MAIERLKTERGWIMYCNTSCWVFGPTFNSRREVDAFIDWCPVDPRSATDATLEGYYREFRDEELCNQCGDYLETDENICGYCQAR